MKKMKGTLKQNKWICIIVLMVMLLNIVLPNVLVISNANSEDLTASEDIESIENIEEVSEKTIEDTQLNSKEEINSNTVQLNSEGTLGEPAGDGTAENPYIITTAEELAAINNDLSSHYVLGANIDLNGYDNWTPIGSMSNQFTGSFNGNLNGTQYKISNLKINSTSQCMGLFGFNSGSLKNIVIENANVTGGMFTGTLAGYSIKPIDNVSVIGNVIVTGTENCIGGLVGNSWGTISNCNTCGTVKVTGTYSSNGGGLVGWSEGPIIDSYSTANVEQGASYGNNIGGLVGYTIKPTTNCYATGNVKTVNNGAGGLAGYSNSSITNCYATGKVEGIDGIGGLVASCSGTIENSYATGDIISTGSLVGGLVGSTSGGLITNSHATGNVNATGDNIGGLVGQVRSSSVTLSYATGNVTTAGKNVGGLIGRYYNVNSNVISEKNYATGNITANENVGGLVGVIEVYPSDTTTEYGITIQNSFATGSAKGTMNIGSLVGGANYTNKGYSKIINCYGIGKVEGTTNAGGLLGFNNGLTATNAYWTPETVGVNTSSAGSQNTIRKMRFQTGYANWDFQNVWAVGNEGKGTIAYLKDLPIPESVYLKNFGIPEFDSGDGTEGNPYVIKTPEQLAEVNYILDGHFVLGADIDLNSYGEWSGIGNPANKFTGSLKGNGFKILNLKRTGSYGYVGLFKYNQGYLKDIVIENVDISSAMSIGAIAGANSGTLENCKATGKIIGTSFNIGGLVGDNSGTIINCISDVEVEGTASNVGGLVGYSSGAIVNSHAIGNVTGSGTVGGLVGSLYNSTVTLTYATGNVTTSGKNVGGLIGYCYTSVNNITIEKSYATGTITGNENVGGLVGKIEAYPSSLNDEYGVTIQNSFALGNTIGTMNIGSLVGGSNYRNKGYSKIINCYGMGKVEGTENAGGLLGFNNGLTSTDSYWAPESVGLYTSGAGTANSIKAMLHETGYNNWDFDTVWAVDDAMTIAYLKDLPKPQAVALVSWNRYMDVVAPNIAQIEPSEIKTSSVIFNTSFQDTLSGVKSIKIYCNNQLQTQVNYNTDVTALKNEQLTVGPLLADTEYEYYMEVTDYGDNVLKTDVAKLRTLELPDVIVTPSKTEYTNENVIITLEVDTSAETQDNFRIQYKINDAAEWITYTQAFEVTENATITTRVTDLYNYSEPKQFVIDNIDKTAPTMIYKYENRILTFTFEDEGGSGLDLCYELHTDKPVEVDEEGNIVIDYNKQTSLEQSNILEQKIKEYGNNYIYVKITDKAGNITEYDLGNFYIPGTHINIEVEKVSNKNFNMKLGSAEFEISEVINITEEEGISVGTTNENGISKLQILGREEGIVEYNFKELIAPNGYEKIEDSILEITYNKYGEVQNVVSNSSNVIVESIKSDSIKLKVVDEKDEEPTFNVRIEAIDAINSNIKIENAIYKTSINAESGEKVTLTSATNAEGVIEIADLNADGEVVINIEQIESPGKYLKNTVATTLVITRDMVSGLIEVVPDKSDADVLYEIKVYSKTIVIKMINTPKENVDQISLNVTETLNVADTNEKIISNVSGLEFTLEHPYGIGQSTATTDENGQIIFGEVPTYKNSNYTFKLKMAENSEYNINEILLNVTYDENGKIVNFEELTEELNSISNSYTEDINTVYNNYSLYLNLVKQVQSEEIFTLKILEKDVEDANRLLENVTYKILYNNGSVDKIITASTNELGEITTKFVKADTVTIKIQETAVPEGYELNNVIKTLVLTRNVITGLMEVNTNLTDSTLNVFTDSATGIVTVQETTKKAEPKETYIDIYFAKTAEVIDGAKLSGVKLQVVETSTNKTYDIITDEEGNSVLKDFYIPNAGKYEFIITELETVYGFKKFEKPVKFEIVYEEIDEELKLSSIVITSGYKYIVNKYYNEYETDTKNQLDLYLEMINFTDSNISKNNIKFIKVDNEGARLSNAVVSVKVLYNNGTYTKQLVAIDKLGTVLQNIAFDDGITTLEIVETQAPTGYVLDTCTYIVEVEKVDGNLSIKKVEGLNNINVVVTEDNNLEIELVNTSITETFTLEIVNEDLNKPDLDMSGSSFNVNINQNNLNVFSKQVSLSSIANTKNTIKINNLSYKDNMKLQIQQTAVSNNYALNSNLYELDITRDFEKQEITVNSVNITDKFDVEVDNENKIIRVTIKNDSTQLLFGIVKSDAENSNINLANSMFKINKYYNHQEGGYKTVGVLKTDATGYGQIFADTFAINSTVLYEISEIVTPTGYKTLGTIGLYVQTDSEGNIVNAYLSEDAALYAQGVCKIIYTSGKYIELNILNEREDLPTYTVYVIDENANSSKEKVQGAEFNLKISSEDGVTLSKNAITNDAGVAEFTGLTGIGKIKLTLQQVAKANGYELDTNIYNILIDREVFANITSEGGNVVTHNIHFNDETDESLDVVVDNVDKVVIITVRNKAEVVVDGDVDGDIDEDIDEDIDGDVGGDAAGNVNGDIGGNSDVNVTENTDDDINEDSDNENDNTISNSEEESDTGEVKGEIDTNTEDNKKSGVNVPQIVAITIYAGVVSLIALLIVLYVMLKRNRDAKNG